MRAAKCRAGQACHEAGRWGIGCYLSLVHQRLRWCLGLTVQEAQLSTAMVPLRNLPDLGIVLIHAR